MKNNSYFSQPKYSNSNRLAQDFKQKYLNSLQLILDDNKFKEKAETLPLLKSSVINKYEKMLTKRNEKLLSQGKNYKIINKTEQNNIGLNKNIKLKKSNIENNSKKIIQMRYIILDKQLTEITLKSIEENSDISNKLADPFSSFFKESNTKIRKSALEQIIDNIFVVKDKSKENENNEDIKEIKKPSLKIDEKNKDIFYKDLEAFENRYKLNTEMEEKNHEKYGKAISDFEEKCQNYNIVTLGQKIDFFYYLYNENAKKKQLFIQTNKIDKLTSNFNSKKASPKSNYYNNLPQYIKKTLPLLKRKSNFFKQNSMSFEGRLIYYHDVKSNFKISDEAINARPKYIEKFERELNKKIKNFKLVQNNFETSPKLIDKIKLFFLKCEITSEKIILRECNINTDSFMYLLSKKFFDFGNLKYLNLSKNNLGDIGGMYLFYLINKYSENLIYLNLSYTNIGKNSCDILIKSLSSNNLKISTLNLGGNNLGDELFSEILVGISSNTFLSKLFIYENNLGRISSSVIGNFLKYDKKLKLLDVSKNNFDDEIITFMLKGLVMNATLETLFLNELGLTNKSFRTFDTTLGINTNLKKIFLEKNKFNFNGIQKLSDILNSNKCLEYLSLVGNNFEYDHINFANEQQRLIKLKVISKSEFFNQIGAMEDINNIYDFLQ